MLPTRLSAYGGGRDVASAKSVVREPRGMVRGQRPRQKYSRPERGEPPRLAPRSDRAGNNFRTLPHRAAVRRAIRFASATSSHRRFLLVCVSNNDRFSTTPSRIDWGLSILGLFSANPLEGFVEIHVFFSKPPLILRGVCRFCRLFRQTL